MKENQNIISELDIQALLSSPLDTKMQIVRKIGKFYKSGNFTQEQQDAALKNNKMQRKEYYHHY
jgi:hypothetical protein